jgi:hypothetical protein
LDVGVLLSQKRSVWEEKERMLEAVDQKIVEADTKTAAKLEQLRKASDNYPTAVRVTVISLFIAFP